MAGVSRACRNCGVEQRQGARFCPRCGQPVEEQFAEERPHPDPASPHHDVSGDWHAATVSQPPYQAPVSPPTAYQPVSPLMGYQPPVNTPPVNTPPVNTPRGPYPPPASYQATPSYPPPDQQTYRPPFEPPRPQTGPTGPTGPRRPPGPSDRDRRDRAPLIWSLLAAVLVVVAVAFVLLQHPFGHHEAAGDTANSSRTTPPVSPSPTASASDSSSPTAATGTERQAASNVAGMLTRSVSDRTAIVSAYNDVANCGPNLASDAGVFTRAANSRTTILANLAAMPGRSALPPALLSDLTKAWQASVAADQALARWASDESAHGCVPNNTSDPGYQASIAPDNEATTYKTDFTTQWNPIGARYGLTTYRPNQL